MGRRSKAAEVVQSAEDQLRAFADRVQAVESEGQNAAAKDDLLHLITFVLDEEEYGLPIRRVREILRVSSITRVPQAPPHVRGVTNVRGRIVPVIEIRTRLGFPPAEITPRSRILTVDVFDRVLGILVDRVSQVARIPTSHLAPDDEVQCLAADYVRGILQFDERLILLLDLEGALSLDPAEPRDRPGRSGGEG